MIKGLSPRALRLLTDDAQKIARRNKNPLLYPEHMVLALLQSGEGIGFWALAELKINLLMFELVLSQNLPKAESFPAGTEMPQGEIPPSRRMRSVFDIAAVESRSMRKEYIGTEHLLLAAFREEESVTARFFSSIPVTLDDLRAAVQKVLEKNSSSATQVRPRLEIRGNRHSGEEPERVQVGEGGKQQRSASILAEFSRDLTALARSGKCDPVVGRDKEIQRVIQILCRRNKNNPVLVGEPGVGKTAIVEGLAARIVAEDVPADLLKKRVLVLDLGLVIAGTKYRGEFEERMKRIMKEISEQKNVILFIDELHTIIGAGGSEGSMDASNMLKPALSRGELQCIGATTLKEYRKYFEKDAALERRFQQVLVAEPTDEETVRILKGIKNKYEEYHHVHYADGVIEQIVKFSRRYITERFLPDKAIDLLDETGSLKKIQCDERPEDLAELEKQIAVLTEEKSLMVQSQNYERAAEVRDQVRKLRLKAEELANRETKHAVTEKNTITVTDVCRVVADITGIPMEQLDTEETKRLINMEQVLHQSVIGQEEAISLVASAVRRSRAGVSSFKRPQGSFIFLGPTGVGKTLLAKTLAKFLFGTEDALIRVDMSDFMEKHTASRLVGAPPGYVGYEEGGVLTEKVRRNPYSVVLLDEIEKAHPDIFNLLLQVLEEGELRDNLGHTVNFRNTVIIMTSNAGARQISNENRLGFSSTVDGLMNYEDMKQSALTELKKILSPELLNRIDDTVVFTTLSEAEVSRILDLQLDELKERLSEQGINIRLKKSARDYLVKNGYDPAFGARPMRRLLQREIEDEVAMLILADKCPEGTQIVVEYKKDKLILVPQPAELQKLPAKKQRAYHLEVPSTPQLILSDSGENGDSREN